MAKRQHYDLIAALCKLVFQGGRNRRFGIVLALNHENSRTAIFSKVRFHQIFFLFQTEGLFIRFLKFGKQKM